MNPASIVPSTSYWLCDQGLLKLLMQYATLAAGSQEPLFTPTQLEMSEGDLDFITPRTPISVRRERHHIELGLKSS